jgi:branched-chain amino acid transport system ATP-binding protein
MLQLDNVTLAYGPIEAVRGLSIEVDDGQLIALLGRNGAGKTTTLNGIVGLNHPKSGTIVYDGVKISSDSPGEVSRRGIAYVPEGRGVFGSLTVLENMQTAAYGHGMRRRTAMAEIKSAIGYFPAIEDRLGQRAGSLSGGEQQMLAIARALVSHPKLLLVDEPGLGLAPIIVGELYRQFNRLNADEGVSILLVEQYVDLALRTASYAYVMEKGELAFETKCGPDQPSVNDVVSAYIS